MIETATSSVYPPDPTLNKRLIKEPPGKLAFPSPDYKTGASLSMLWWRNYYYQLAATIYCNSLLQERPTGYDPVPPAWRASDLPIDLWSRSNKRATRIELAVLGWRPRAVYRLATPAFEESPEIGSGGPLRPPWLATKLCTLHLAFQIVLTTCG